MVSCETAFKYLELLQQQLKKKRGAYETGAPEVFLIEHDDYHAEYVGRTADQKQFFLTTPFEPLGHEFVALFLFDLKGHLIDSVIEDFGLRNEMDEDLRNRRVSELLAGLGPVTFRTIGIRPFAVEKFGIPFGFIPFPFEDTEDPNYELLGKALTGAYGPAIAMATKAIKRIKWSVSINPGDYMCFFAPWDQGTYDT